MTSFTEIESANLSRCVCLLSRRDRWSAQRRQRNRHNLPGSVDYGRTSEIADNLTIGARAERVVQVRVDILADGADGSVAKRKLTQAFVRR